MDPDQRLTVPAMLERLGAIAESKGYDLRAPLCIKKTEPIVNTHNDIGQGDGLNNGPKRPPPPRPVGQLPSRPPPPATVRSLP